MNFQQIRDFVNPAVEQATGIAPIENLSMPVPVAYVPVQLVIDGALSPTSENPVQNKVITVAIQNLDGRITAVEGQFSEGVTEAVNNWLAAHPEATTTVQDGAISYAKLDASLKGKADAVSKLSEDVENLSDVVLGDNKYPDTNSINFSNNTAVVNNGDGTYTIGTTDYGVTVFGTSVELTAGIYCLYGVPFGYSFISTTPNTSGEVHRNPTNAPLWFTLAADTTCYLGYRCASQPETEFIITPFLRGVGLQKDVADLKNTVSTIYESPNFTGTPTAPTAPAGTRSTQLATTQFVASAVNALGVPVATNAAAVTQIPENSDLNNYLTVGNYRISTSAIAITVANRPINDSGRLIVMGVGHPNTIMQVFISNGRRIYLRTNAAASWSVWQELAVKTDEYNALFTDVDRLNIAANGLYNFIKALEGMGLYNIKFANSPVPLNLSNYVTSYAGNTQNVHPKVLYFPSGFGGHKYWMAYTPYPFGRSQYENPCIAFSDDGYSWENITGNPIDDPAGNGYDSDTHLVYRNDINTLECWYRYVSDTEPRYETIYRQTSTDGITWSEKEVVLQSATAGATHYMSPAIIWDGEKYQIWVVDGTKIVYYEAQPTTITTWNRVRNYTLTFTDDGQTASPWHLDVIYTDGSYIFLVMCMISSSPRNGWSLFITTSADNITFGTPEKVLEGQPSGWDVFMYRSSIIKIGNTYRIYYSAMTADTVCGIGISESDTLTGFIGKLLL